MKIRFPVQGTVNANSCLALELEKVVAYNFDQHRDLHLWFKGQSDSVIIQEKEIGKDYFQVLLTLLESQFLHVDELKHRIDLLISMRTPFPLNQ